MHAYAAKPEHAAHGSTAHRAGSAHGTTAHRPALPSAARAPAQTPAATPAERKAAQPVKQHAGVKDEKAHSADPAKPVEAPTISHKTVDSALEAPDSRDIVGVSESVKFERNMAGVWGCSAGYLVPYDENSIHWIAPARATVAQVWLTANGQKAVAQMTVIEPECVFAEKLGEISSADFGDGKMSPCVGMLSSFRYRPLTVSFVGIRTKELPGPALGVVGYFDDLFVKTGRTKYLDHNPYDQFQNVSKDNTLVSHDTAALLRQRPLGSSFLSGAPKGILKTMPPYTDGSYYWSIPNHFVGFGETGDGKCFDTVTQSFELKADGTHTVTKLGFTASRKFEWL
ncbi:MAG TPA: hypothetical protein VG889_11635 [Rhizomicrobium sp.]|nr:hypothetical protein [Rhizomicrobium sp.]